MPDTLALIIWLIAGVAGGNAAGELLKGDYDLGPGNTVAGAFGSEPLSAPACAVERTHKIGRAIRCQSL